MYALENGPPTKVTNRFPVSDDKVPVLALVNAIWLHHDTTKPEDAALNAWDLNRTLASAVDAARARKTKLLMCELQNSSWNQTSDQILDDIWEKEIPVLPPGVRPPAIRDGQWIQPSTTLRAVLGRWCLFDDRSDGS